MTTQRHGTAPSGPVEVDGRALGLRFTSGIVELIAALVGDVPVFAVRVERDTVPVRMPSLPWPRQLRCLQVGLHCDGDEDATSVADRLGLALAGSRRYPGTVDGVQFVESTWTGWLTAPGAARLPVPVSVTVLGAHQEPSPVGEPGDGQTRPTPAVA